MALIVQKYGGTSVGTVEKIKNVAKRVARTKAEGNDVVVVVSAMSGETNRLLGLAHQISDIPNERELDVVAATGEQVTIGLLAIALTEMGCKAKSFCGFQIPVLTDAAYVKARIRQIRGETITQALKEGHVAVVAGFQGIDDSGSITTLGRGGSDTSAVALAAALQAERCDIYTDVDGVYTADPRIALDATQLPVIGYEEMMELANQGAQVMQVRAVELGWVNDVVIEVLSSFEDAPGTLIKEDPLVEQRNKVRGLAHDRNVAKITLVEVPDRPGVAALVFEPLAAEGINVDMIVQNIGHRGATDLSFTISQVELARAKRLLEPIVRDLGFREITTDTSVAKVSIVGAGIQNAPGYAARMFRTLADAGVNIEMISTSEIRITTIIAEDALETALQALHAAFELERPETVEAAAAG